MFGIENNDPSVIWDTEEEAPRIFQLFDGTIVVSKEFELLWNNIKVNKFDLQKLPKHLLVYGDSQSTKEVESVQKTDSLIKRAFNKLHRIILE